MSTDLIINEQLVIPGGDLSFIAVRSSGPGGQNVNKVATKVELRFDLPGCEALSEGVKARLRAKCKNRLDADGRVVITSEATRNRIRNVTDARAKLAALIREALVPPKRRRPTKPSRASQRRRVEDKRKRSSLKKSRSQRFSPE